MKLELSNFDLKATEKNTLAILVCEDKQINENRTINSFLKKVQEIEAFKGEKGEEMILYSPPDLGVHRVLIYGLGKSEKLSPETLRVAAGKAVRCGIRKKLDEIWFAAPSDRKTGMAMEAILEALMEGAFLGNHIYDAYKGEKKRTPVATLGIFAKAADAKKYADIVDRVTAVCQSTVLAREWVSIPANDKLPARYAEMVAKEAEAVGLTVRVMEEDALVEKGFGAILAVSKASDAPPRLVILEYKAEKAKETIAMVGKGVIFDSGGMSLKTGSGMETMKCDMAGSAAVAATLIAAARTKPNVNLIGVLPMVENMISGHAIHVGDIIKTYAGKTVEVLNTDAEGRLILIDAIAYAIEQYKPGITIDLATLTGACVIALGEKYAGIFSQDDDLVKALVTSAEKTHERCWPMPLPEDYKELLKSEFADISNMPSTRSGGAISAALFISEFVKDTRWAHIDIAGPAYIRKENAYCGAGGTGFGVRLLCDFLSKF